MVQPNSAHSANSQKMEEEWVQFFSQNPGAGGGAGETFRSGCSALTTMLIFGLNSASYCTQSAATAANCTVITVTEVGIKHDWIIFAEKTQIYVLNKYCPRERRERGREGS